MHAGSGGRGIMRSKRQHVPQRLEELDQHLGFGPDRVSRGAAPQQPGIAPIASIDPSSEWPFESGARSGWFPPLAVPLERTGDRALRPHGGVIERDQQIGVRVLDPYASWPQAHVDLAALVEAAGPAIGIRESQLYYADVLPEPAKREAESAFHTGSQALGQLDT